jgi:hypothetical protein
MYAIAPKRRRKPMVCQDDMDIEIKEIIPAITATSG